MNDIILPDIIAFIVFGLLLGAFLGIILAFALRWPPFVWMGMLSGIVSGVLTHWLTKRNPHLAQAMPDPTPAAAPLSDLQHIINSYERIFHSWASHANVTDLCFFGAIIVIAVMIVKVTRIHSESRHPPYYHDPRYLPPLPPGLERYYQPRQLEAPEERRRNLPAVRPEDINRTI